MQIRTMLTFYGHRSRTQSYAYQYLSCHVFGTIYTILTSVSLWTSASFAFERTLMELFFFKLFGTTRKHALVMSFIFFIFIPLCRIPTILGKKVLPDPTNISLFICTYRMSSLLLRFEQIQAWINMLGPCFVHFVSNILTCISTARRKVYLSNSSNNRLSCWHAWLHQISLHCDYFVCPLVIILCQLPHLIFFAITNTLHPCLEPKLSAYSHLHILSGLLITVPQTLTFFIFIYPSKSYMGEFYSSSPIGRFLQKLK
ncbi:unnamed protein product [Rotaria sordida]|uniref:Uncharacterized protein n=1 Tax=Rotaria sordida TaxID=392033 RepID=A0A816DQX8_9BILA|nr:unnamed protein product [Rotaria sordida]CAF1455385.1 unnamed protein product [Rotaria sordida]CAF1459651.1 unnamed protein product [Rotaria sordida]CAF1494714.1 unnamed protein product [Rotaria sordida]CAF1640319.1 unnamed protein product [Rotaria sordida]